MPGKILKKVIQSLPVQKKFIFHFGVPPGGRRGHTFRDPMPQDAILNQKKLTTNDRPYQKIIRTETMGPKGSRQDLTRPGHKAAKFILGWLCAACGFQKNKLREPSPPLGGEPVGLGRFFFSKRKVYPKIKQYGTNYCRVTRISRAHTKFRKKTTLLLGSGW